MATHVVNSITRLVNADGNFKKGIKKDLKLDVEDSPLAVVSIIGAQSSGKLASQRTTKGIWIAKYQLKRGCILVIDTEGSDGTERGGNETFARQTLVFAMAISRVVIINMMCADIGRESGAGWPLLRMACEVQLRIMRRHQVKLLFVIRDITESPLPALKNQIMAEMDKILKTKTKRQSQANAPLSSFFKVKKLRNWIIYRTTSKESTSERIPTSSFTTYAEQIWNEIKKNKDLDLPSYMILVAKEQCERIADKQRDSFGKNESWLQIKENVKSGSIIRGFGKDVRDLISARLSRYDREAEKYDHTMRKKCRKVLVSKLLEIIKPTYDCLVASMRSKTLDDFRKAALNELKKKGKLKAVKVQDFITKFDDLLEDAVIKEAKWTHASTQRKTLEKDMNSIKDVINAINTTLGEQKKNKKDMWMAIAMGILSIGFSGLSVALGNPIVLPGVPKNIISLVLKMFGP